GGGSGDAGWAEFRTPPLPARLRRVALPRGGGRGWFARTRHRRGADEAGECGAVEQGGGAAFFRGAGGYRQRQGGGGGGGVFDHRCLCAAAAQPRLPRAMGGGGRDRARAAGAGADRGGERRVREWRGACA